MERERVGCEARIDNLLEAIADGTIAKELAKRKVAAEKSKLQAVRARLAKPAPVPSPAPENSQEAIQAALEATGRRSARRRDLHGSIIQAVTVTPEGTRSSRASTSETQRPPWKVAECMLHLVAGARW
jgi:hypothetical protein